MGAGIARDGRLRGGALRQVGEALRRRDFRWWFGSQILSASGAATQNVALSWIVLQQSGDALWLSMLTVCALGPVLLLGAWAGALVDRMDRRRLLTVTQTLMMIIGVTLSVLAATGVLNLALILSIAVLTGVVSAVDAPARQVYVVDLVGPAGVASAVGLWEVALNSSRVLGPSVGGVLLATTGPAMCFLVNALSYLLPLYVLARLAPRHAEERIRAPRERGSISSGLRYAWRTPVVRACLPMAAASGMIFTMGIALPVLATRALHVGGGGYGALMAAFGIGALPGALLAAGHPVPSGRRVRLLALATAVAVLLVACAQNLAEAFGAMMATGFTSIWFIASANTLVQLRTEPDMQGRVMGLWNTALPGTVPLTGFLVAAVSQHVGARLGFSVSGIALLGAALLGWRALADRENGGTRRLAG
ncbi:MFS transporter [Peterkaempfera sp. SMS 1(5)a]|uniref:MFS transporter n=1 Tax=Peterkaempfera podocarpi TaxID=3232308 RepID=UPI00366B2B9A